MSSSVTMPQTDIMSNRVRMSLVSTSKKKMQVPKGTGPGVRRSKRPLSACHTRRKCCMETTQNSVKGQVRYKVWSVGGCHCIWSGHRMSFDNFSLFDPRIDHKTSSITISSVPWHLCARSLFESRVALRIKHPYKEQARAYHISCKKKTP